MTSLPAHHRKIIAALKTHIGDKALDMRIQKPLFEALARVRTETWTQALITAGDQIDALKDKSGAVGIVDRLRLQGPDHDNLCGACQALQGHTAMVCTSWASPHWASPRGLNSSACGAFSPAPAAPPSTVTATLTMTAAE